MGRVTQESYYENGSSTVSRTVTYAYDSAGALATTKDSATGRTTKCYYDDVGRVNRQYTTNSSTYHNLYYAYDSLGQIAQVRETYKPSGTAATEEYLTNYGYANGHITAVGNNNGTSADSSDDFYAFYSYDGFDRLKKKSKQRISDDSVVTVLDETLTYNNLHQVTSLVLDSAGFDRTYTYTYDANGNITSVTGGGYTTRYQYDSQNQLIREDNQAAGKTWVWIYDEAGNITTKKEYAYTTAIVLTQGYTTVSYGYGNAAWGDLLISYNGKAITYDAIGNPLSDGTWSYTWTQGRQLAAMSGNGQSWSFTYDANGMRTERRNANGGYTYTYTYNGSQLSRMSYGSHVMWFTYGADGTPLTINLNGTTYYYVTNLQGDVVGILDSTGTQVVGYTYDAWGKLLSTTGSMASTLGLHNPLRYRGYVYDRETGLYYLQSRYYNPTWGRFINADTYASTGQGLIGHNMFVYCGNNPVARIDIAGESFSIVLGFNFNIFGWGIIGSINLVSTEENFGIQFSYYISSDEEMSQKNNCTLGIDIGAYIGIQYTEKNNMKDLEGYAKATGGDLIAGIDLLTEENGRYLGWQIGSSALSANMHSLYTNTETLISIPTLNIFEILTDWF